MTVGINDQIKLPHSAMVLSAGLGTRMRPLTNDKPKPLIEVAGKTLLDHNLDQLHNAGIKNTVVNAHYLADQIFTHVETREHPEIKISDERDELLDSGGGIKLALPQLGNDPFFILNSDSFWIDRQVNTLQKMAQTWNSLGDKVDILLLLAQKENAVGFDGAGDFFMEGDGTLKRRGDAPHAPYIYAGCAILRPEIFAATSEKKFSLNEQFNEAIAHGRMSGITLNGLWLHVGTPEAIALSEQAIKAERIGA